MYICLCNILRVTQVLTSCKTRFDDDSVILPTSDSVLPISTRSNFGCFRPGDFQRVQFQLVLSRRVHSQECALSSLIFYRIQRDSGVCSITRGARKRRVTIARDYYLLRADNRANRAERGELRVVVINEPGTRTAANRGEALLCQFRFERETR